MQANQWNPEAYRSSASFVFDSSHDLVDWLDPQPGEAILDLGCGTGEHAARIAARGAVPLGLDRSEAMIEAARAAHPAPPAIEWAVGDGQELSYVERFDGVFSNAALHWMTRADDVARGVARALCPGGRFVLEMPEVTNVARTIDAIDRALAECVGQRFDRSRWYFPTLDQHTACLERADLRVTSAYVFERPSFVADRADASGLRVWLELFANDLLEALGDRAGDVVACAEEHARSLRTDGGYTLDYVRLRMKAVRPG